MNYADADKLRTNSIFIYNNYSESLSNKLQAFDDYLHAEYCLQIIKNQYDDSFLNYEDFCKYEVGDMLLEDKYEKDFKEGIKNKYGYKVRETYYLDNETS